MNTNTLPKTHSHPPESATRLDRFALRLGYTLVSWANRSDELHQARLERRREKHARMLERARLRADVERDRERWDTDSSLLFRYLQ